MTAATLPGQSSRAAPRSARIALSMLERLAHGTLRLRLPDGSTRSFGAGAPEAELTITSWAVFDEVLRRGDIGFAQAWIDGLWDSDHLEEVLALMVANRAALEAVIYGTWWGQVLDRIRHLFNRNTRSGARRNISAHYDLGNDFYRLWLDPSMTYSSAIFEGQTDRSLEAAQHAKNRRLLAELGLTPAQRLLEIGCGWGGLAEAASAQGLAVTGLTLSREQRAFALERLGWAGADQAQILLKDYRDESGQYDGIASVEMFEAVGEAWWPAYFDCLRRCLKPGARAVIQTIVIADHLFDRYRRGTDFIQQYVFPGGMLPSPSGFEALAQRAGLKVANRFAFGADYARTLAIWRERFLAVLPQVHEQGFDRRFIRTWSFYLAYCEAAFRHGSTDVIQYTLEAPGP
jgi:cyclopropane-fatty-acyl-phospholipid synthase